MTDAPGTKPALTWKILQQQDAATSTAIISALDCDASFITASEKQAKAIRQRDDEDAEKLAKGIEAAIAKKVLPGDLTPEPYKEIDVLGKTPDQVASLIISDLGEAAKTGCVIVMCGLSGTGKGTTVARLKSLLPNAQTWSNGNIFRSLTLLCARWCAKQAEITGEPVAIEAALTPKNLKDFMNCLTFGKFGAGGAFDTHIKSEALDVDELVGNVQNTILRGPDVSKNIPTVAEQTQGEVVAFVAGALKQLADAGKIVLLEGRAQTVDFVRTPFRYTLTLSDPLLVGKRRVAQVVGADAFKKVSSTITNDKEPSAETIIAAVNDSLSIFN
jgi:cytidylate kinase